MFYATWRESKRFQFLFGLIFALVLFFNIFLSNSVSAATVWEGIPLTTGIVGEDLYTASFGRAADVYGDYWVITAPGFKTVYVMQKSGDTWNLVAKLTPSDGAAAEGYGQSVAMHGNTIVVGATQLGRQGSIYIYESSGSWSDMTETYKISGQPSVYMNMAGSVAYFNHWGDYFGYAVDVYNDTVVVGAHASNINQGLVYVYQKPADGWASGTAVPVVLSPSATGFSETYAMFGRAVALNSNYLLATSLSYTEAYGPHPANGFLFAYDLPISTSSIPRVLRSSDQNPGDGFGASLDLTESGTAVVGATGASSNNGQNGGAAYVFEAPWNDGNVEMAKLTGSTSRRDDNFGVVVSITDERVLVGAPRNDIIPEYNPNAITQYPRTNFLNDEQGAAYVFVRNGNWQTGTENFEITGPRYQRTYFGSQVEQIGNNMLVLVGDQYNNTARQEIFEFNFNDYENLNPRGEFVSQPVQADDSSGYVNASVLLTNTANLPMDMSVDFSFDGTAWYAADVWNLVTSSAGSFSTYGTSEIKNITETAGGNLISFSWDTRFSSARYKLLEENLFADNDVYLRVRYGTFRTGMQEQYLYSGAGLVSNQFHIHNDFSTLQSPGPITLTPATSSMMLSWPRFLGGAYFVSSTITSEPIRVEVVSTYWGPKHTFNELSPNTQYSFQVASQSDESGLVTPYSAVASAYTLANSPANLVATVNGRNQITLNWSSDASEYYADSGINNSGWISATTYAFAGLTCATDYNFSVKSRNGDQMETTAATTTARTTDCGTGGDETNTGSSGSGSYIRPIVPTINSVVLVEQSPVSSNTIHILSDVANATQMTISEDRNFVGSTWGAYSANQEYILSEGNGNKIIYVKFRSASGGESSVREMRVVLANLGNQTVPGENSQQFVATTSSVISADSSNNNVGNNASNNTTANAVSAANLLKIKLPTTSDDNNLVPTAAAGNNATVSGVKIKNNPFGIFGSENNWVLLLSGFVAIIAIVIGWFVWRRKKSTDVK